nr:hypothetical protein BaRGS_022796 [Batillaria attramentaria]
MSEIFKPLTILLWCGGLYVVKFSSKNKIRTALTWSMNVFFVSLSVFSTACLCIFNVSSLLDKIHEGKHMIASLYTTVYAFSVLYFALSEPTTTKQFRKLTRQLNEYVQRYDPRRKFWLTPRLVCAVSVVTFVAAVAVPVYLGLSNVLDLHGESSPSTLRPLQTPFTVVAAAFYSTLTFFFASVKYLVVWCVLQTHAHRLVKDMRVHGQGMLACSPGTLEEMRLRHEELCSIVSRAGNVVCHYLAVVYVGGITCFLFVLHGFVYRTLVMEEFLHMTTFFVELTFTLIFVNITAVILHAKVQYRLQSFSVGLICLVASDFCRRKPVQLNRSRVKSAVKTFLNVVFVSLSVVSHSCHVAFHCLGLLINIQKGRNVIPSLYTTTFAVGILFVSVFVPLTTPKHLRKLLACLDNYHDQYDPGRDFSRLRKAVIVVSTVNVVLTSLWSPLVMNGLVGLLGSGDTGCTALAGDDLQIPYRLAYTVSLYSSIAFSFSWIESCLLCFILLTDATRLVKAVRSFLPETLEGNPSLVEDLRIRHEKLCRLISKTSHVIGHVIAAVYVTGIPCFLFVLHGFVYRKLTLHEFLRMTFFFAELTFILIFFNIAGTMLNIKMHQPAEFLFPLNIEKMPERGPEIVAAFLARLQGAPIGFTVYRLFTIDTSTILMVCGTILTYAVVIIQFQPGVGGSSVSGVSVGTTPHPVMSTPPTALNGSV